MTVSEVSKIAGVSVRTLHFYDEKGLLPPAEITEAGYRLYDEKSLERLRHIMFFRELEFPLSEIGKILDSPNFDRNEALLQQENLLRLKIERLQRLVRLAHNERERKTDKMDFTAFDSKKIEEYTEKAKEKWGETAAFKEFEEKQKGRGKSDMKAITEGIMTFFEDFGKIKDEVSPEAPKAQEICAKLQGYITENFYNCTKEIFSSLGTMYSAGGEMTDNINAAGGPGTADFASAAIAEFCK